MASNTDSGSGAQPTIGIDVGGSLVKVAMVEGSDGSGPGKHPLEAFVRSMTCADGGRVLPGGWRRATVSTPAGAVRVLVLPVSDIAQAIREVEALGPPAGGPLRVAATGGGALRHRAELERGLGAQLAVVKELEAVARGLLTDADGPLAGEQALVCNVGTGVSLASVDAQGGVERVSGSGIGGATFWGLVRRLTQFGDFDEAVAAAHGSGRLGAADTLVEDIYGREASKEIGLAPDLVAGFLGKLDAKGLTDADVVAALLRMFVSNIGQLAVFQARLLAVDAVYFTGGFVPSASPEQSGTAQVIRGAIADAVAFWSAGKVAARFPRNSALLGAIGALHCARATSE